MPRVKIFLAQGALLFSALACVTLFGEPSTGTEVSFVTEEPQVEEASAAEEPISCPLLMNDILKIATSATGDGPNELEDKLNEIENDGLLVTYLVNGNEISDPLYEDVPERFQDEQEDAVTQQQIWDFFIALIPLENRTMIGEYAIITDGKDNTLAAVEQTQTDPDLWVLEVDILDSSDTHNLTFTLLHEFGHLLTLEPNQVPPSLAVFNDPNDDELYYQEVAACPYYFPGEGCPHEDSYINAFYEQFWVEIYEEWNRINLEEDDDIYYEKLDAFYQKYDDQFVTDYAVTNPAEDIAESWTFFVLSNEPAASTSADEKVHFFYEYPELVQLRDDIRSNICISFPQ